MNYNALNPKPSVYEFTDQLGIDTSADIGPNTWIPRLAELNAEGSTSMEVGENGANYLFTKLEYCEGEEVRANRMIATIYPGFRAELAYWTKAADRKLLAVHRGNGVLVVGNPKNESTNVFQLDPEITPQVTLPPGRFYALEAVDYGAGPLVISGYYEPPANFGELELYINPGDYELEAPEGTVRVPDEFRIYFAKH
ncbi:hypothetical protein HYS84_01260 [Candidatus Saccharibacteria bacterium]|nr:hypothetical protein [Candidatus Saccharibacteria bacterium]